MPSTSHAPTPALERRASVVREALRALSLDGLIVTSLPNIRYLTNFTGTAAIVVVTADRLRFITDGRYATAVDRMDEARAFDVVIVEGSYDALLAKTLAALDARRIGFEAAHLVVSRFQWLVSTLARDAQTPIELVPTEAIVERARVRKDEYEIVTLREAARRLSAVTADVVGSIKAGQTERDVALAIDRTIHQAGFSKPAFDTIVASGPNAALPHARPGERKLTEGDLVVLDFGGVYDSYCVDLTRTVAIGRASERARDVYAAVRDAHDRAIAAVAPGVSRFAVDAAARDALAARGLAAAFTHGTGHGLGLEVHEDPRIVRGRQDVNPIDELLAPGMVFTIEPGAYVPNWGGVRIEDDVLVTGHGVEVLTGATTELLEI